MLEGVASYYADEFNGRKTASGEVFEPHRFTAAHRTLPLGSEVRVTDLRNGRWVIVTVNDRGPYIHGRIIDLSMGAAEALRMKPKGLARVRIEVLSEPTLPLKYAKAAARKAGKKPPTGDAEAGAAMPPTETPHQRKRDETLAEGVKSH